MFTFVEKNGDHRFKIKAASFQDAKVSKVKIKVRQIQFIRLMLQEDIKGKGVEQGLIETFGRKPKNVTKDLRMEIKSLQTLLKTK